MERRDISCMAECDPTPSSPAKRSLRIESSREKRSNAIQRSDSLLGVGFNSGRHLASPGRAR